MVGDQDHQLRRELVARVAERLKERGVPVELVIYPGAFNDLDDILGRRAADVGGATLPYQHYKVIGFCNLTLADEAIRLNPYAGAFLPCRAVVFRPLGAGETIIVTARPSFLVNAVRVPGMERIMEQAEADIQAILKDVSGE